MTLCLGFPSFRWCPRCYFKSQNGCQWTELDFSGIVPVCGNSKKCYCPRYLAVSRFGELFDHGLSAVYDIHMREMSHRFGN